MHVAKDRSQDSGSASTLLSFCPTPASLDLRVGAQVMLVKNLTSNLVNGTVGVVTKFNGVEEGSVPQQAKCNIPIVKLTLTDGRMLTIPV